jgi:hypothetical protein
MCVLAGILVILIGGSLFFKAFSLLGVNTPDSYRVGGPAGVFHRHWFVAQTSGGIRTNCFSQVHNSNVALAGLPVFAGRLRLYRRLRGIS